MSTATAPRVHAGSNTFSCETCARHDHCRMERGNGCHGTRWTYKNNEKTDVAVTWKCGEYAGVNNMAFSEPWIDFDAIDEESLVQRFALSRSQSLSLEYPNKEQATKARKRLAWYVNRIFAATRRVACYRDGKTVTIAR